MSQSCLFLFFTICYSAFDGRASLKIIRLAAAVFILKKVIHILNAGIPETASSEDQQYRLVNPFSIAVLLEPPRITYFCEISDMQAFFFYLAYPFIYLIASLPFPLLYACSDICYFVLKISGYRKKVVLKNLRNSFPEKSEKEINTLVSQYFRYLCDLTLETLKTMHMTEKDFMDRFTFAYQPWLQRYFDEKRSIILVMGHYGNWEWAGPAFELSTPFQLIVIYRPLSNPYFEKMLSRMRTRQGLKITPVNKTLRDMVANRGSVTATALVADQAASKKDAYWMEFLHQDTAVFTGPEKLAKKFDYPVIFINTRRIKRGYYHMEPELLFDDPRKTKEGEITVAFNKRLEHEIRKDPTIWLWSHKRWKHKRPVTATNV